MIDGHFKLVQFNSQKDPQNYLCHCWLYDGELVTGTESGDILLFEEFELKSTFSIKMLSDKLSSSAVTCLESYSKGCICGSCNGMLYMYERARDDKSGFRCKYVLCPESGNSSIIHLALSPSEESLICGTESRQMYTASLSSLDCLKSEAHRPEFLDCISSFHSPGPSGSSRVIAIDVCVWKPWIATCGEDRFLRIWNYHQKITETVREFAMKLSAVSMHPCGVFVLVGCEESLLELNLLMNTASASRELFLRAPTKCCYSNGGQSFAAIANSLIHVHSAYARNAVATLRGNDGQVCDVKWDRTDHRILSVTRSGVIIVWKLFWGVRECEEATPHISYNAAAAAPNLARIYTLADDCILRETHADSSSLLTTTVLHVNRQPGSCMSMSRCQDTIFVGGSCPRKPNSVRAIGLPLGSEPISENTAEYQTHASEVSAMAILHDGSLLFSAGMDGSMAIFEISHTNQRGDVCSGHIHSDVTSTRAFSEEILVGKSIINARTDELMNHRIALNDLILKHDHQVHLKQIKYEDRMKIILEHFHLETEGDNTEFLDLCDAKLCLEGTYQKRMQTLETKHCAEKQQLHWYYEAACQEEIRRVQKFLDEQDESDRLWLRETQELCSNHQANVVRSHTGYDGEIEQEQDLQQLIIQETQQIRCMCKEVSSLVETDGDYETVRIKQSYQAKLMLEHALTVALKADNAAMKTRSSSMLQDVDNQREEIRSVHDKLTEQAETIDGLEKEIQGHKKEIREREATLADKDKRVLELKHKNQELEKFKFVLDYKTKELKQQIEPRETEISDLLRQFEEMELELEQYHRANSTLDLMIGELRLKMVSLYKEGEYHKNSMSIYVKDLIALRVALRECAQIATHRELKRGIQKLRDIDVRAKMTTLTPSESAIVVQMGQMAYERERQYLERHKDSLLRNRLRNVQAHIHEHGNP